MEITDMVALLSHLGLPFAGGADLQIFYARTSPRSVRIYSTWQSISPKTRGARWICWSSAGANSSVFADLCCEYLLGRHFAVWQSARPPPAVAPAPAPPPSVWEALRLRTKWTC